MVLDSFSFAEKVLPSNTFKDGSHNWATSAFTQRCTSALKTGSRAVKYWAPWSHCQCSVTRVLSLPDTPRLFSNIVTSNPHFSNAVAQLKPAIPAPTMATLFCFIMIYNQPCNHLLVSFNCCQGNNWLRLECTASSSMSSMGVSGNAGKISFVTIKCFSLLAGIAAVHLLLSSFFGLVIVLDDCILSSIGFSRKLYSVIKFKIGIKKETFMPTAYSTYINFYCSERK